MNYNTIIIGSGCAGFNAADWLYDLGIKDIAIITEGVDMGTSRNTGSDKQTYYKLTLAGDQPDSVYEMACTLFDGGSMHGDTAMIQAACSAKAFMKLVNLGLPFPTNAYGAYVGYKTDHDPRQRATSCGPLTSKLMTEALEREVTRKGVSILDGYQVIKLLTDGSQVQGLVALNRESNDYHVMHAQNIILATGGPAGIYADTVFPISQTGATGLALEAGAKAVNLQEWQYGLASIDFRWNVSGTYQQVLPKYISVDAGGQAHEFLPEYFENPTKALDMVFLKGYQWPFDVRKIEGSSQIDLLVAKENEKGRTVYMDFRHNPAGLDFDQLSEEAHQYLKKSDALFGTPIQRLAKMNPQAIELYKNNGIDLYNEPLKVAVCAQHCNGGIAVDANWESSVKGLYVAGEAAGTFGVYRPGGSALNDTQVGSMRAAEHIAHKKNEKGEKETAETTQAEFTPPSITYNKQPNWQTRQAEIQKQMSRYAAYTRYPTQMDKLYQELCQLKDNFFNEVTIASDVELPNLYKFYDALATQIAVLSAMLFGAKQMGSRGSALVKDAQNSRGSYNDKVVVTHCPHSCFEPVRPMPSCDDWFETVWNKSN
ncbi:MAG: FAD-binding protein [Defluviitaleaceae bacterium]|nr:FAD-binding protein [Defluviitaleaceae bacterium]